MPPLLVFRKLVSSLFLFRIIYWLFGGLLIIGVVYIFLTKRDLDLEWIVLGILGFGLWASRHGLPLMVIFSLLGLGVLASIFLIQHPLMDRAAFYLPADVLFIYLPLSMAKRRSSSSSARLFQQTGMAHLLAISGLHIALIYGLFYYLFKSLINFSLKMTEWVHQNLLIQLMALSFIWIYIFLLEWPVPALRATTMLSLMVLGNLLGLVQFPIFSFARTSFIFLIAEPRMLNDP